MPAHALANAERAFAGTILTLMILAFPVLAQHELTDRIQQMSCTCAYKITSKSPASHQLVIATEL